MHASTCLQSHGAAACYSVFFPLHCWYALFNTEVTLSKLVTQSVKQKPLCRPNCESVIKVHVCSTHCCWYFSHQDVMCDSFGFLSEDRCQCFGWTIFFWDAYEVFVQDACCRLYEELQLSGFSVDWCLLATEKNCPKLFCWHNYTFWPNVRQTPHTTLCKINMLINLRPYVHTICVCVCVCVCFSATSSKSCTAWSFFLIQSGYAFHRTEHPCCYLTLSSRRNIGRTHVLLEAAVQLSHYSESVFSVFVSPPADLSVREHKKEEADHHAWQRHVADMAI